MKKRVKSVFLNEFDKASREIVRLETEKGELIRAKNELNLLINELENQNEKELDENRNLNEKYQNLTNEYFFLKESYEEIMKENIEMRTEIEKKDIRINTLTTELDEIKNVIGKLTEVRVILNKYFSSFFENFTYFN